MLEQHSTFYQTWDSRHLHRFVEVDFLFSGSHYLRILQRNVHNVGTLQLVVYLLQVKKVMVMGHSSCGGIKALMTMDSFSRDFVGTWMQIGMPAKEATLAQVGDKPLPEQCSFCEQEAVNVSLNNLLTFPFVEERIRKGELELYSMHYDFHDGKLTSWKAAPSVATACPTVKYITSTTW